MANSFLVPAAIGLMGNRQRQGQSLLGLLGGAAPIPQADQFDEMMFARAPNGYQESAASTPAAPQYFAAGGIDPAATAQRARVNPLNVVFRGLAPKLSGALDAERARLQAEADRPIQAARLAAALQDATPLERALAYGAGSTEWRENRAKGFAPITAAPGTNIYVPGAGQVIANEERKVVGDRVVALGTGSQAPRELMQVQPSYADETARINATNPTNVGLDQRLVDQSGRVLLEAQPKLDTVSLSAGGEVVAIDPRTGQPISRTASASEKPLSESALRTIDEAEQNITRLGVSIGRARGILQQIQGGDLNLGPVTNAISGVRNATGRSNANSLNYDALLAWAKSARNAALSANTGVQTDQDAIRELDTILSGTRDERVVSAALQRYIDLQEQTTEALQGAIQRRGGAIAPAQDGIVSVSGPEEARALPRGTRFRTPDGRIMEVR